MNKKFLKLLEKALGIKEGDLSSKFDSENDDDIDVESAIQIVSDTLKSKTKIAHDGGMGKMAKRIRTLAKDKLNVETTDDVDIETVFEQVVSTAKESNGGLTESDVKGSKWYKDIEISFASKETERKDALSIENNNLKKQVRELTFNKSAVDALTANKFKIPKAEKVKESLMGVFLKNYENLEQKKDGFYLGGKRIEDENHQPLNLEDIHIHFASMVFEKDEDDDDDSEKTAPETIVAKRKTTNQKRFKSDEELNAYLLTETDIEKKTKAIEEFNS